MGHPQPDRIPGTWLGATVVILGSGPSLTLEQVEYVKGTNAKVIAINDTVKLAPWADILYFCDMRWYDWHAELVQAFAGTVVTLRNYGLKYFLPNLICLEPYHGRNLSPDPTKVYTGHNSGVQAINVAFSAGAEKIILLGIDVKPLGKKTHWFGDHPVTTSLDTMALWELGFNRIASELTMHDMEIFNASPGTGLKCFPTAELAQVL